jgi:integrase
MTVPTPRQVGALLAAADDRFTASSAVCLRRATPRRGGGTAGRRCRLPPTPPARQPAGAARPRRRRGAEGPKHGSERTIVVPDRLLNPVAAHIAQHLAAGGPEPWLFATSAGTPPHQNTVGHQWRKTTTAARFGGPGLHDLRHFFASGLIASGCDVVTGQRALGHASATTTLNTYGHLWPDAEDRTRAATEGLMAASLDNFADHLRTKRRP